MRSPRAVPLLLLTLVFPAAAQRGAAPAGRAAAGHAGFASSPRTGLSSSAVRGLAPAARYGATVRSPNTSQTSLFLPPGITSTRPVFYSNGIRRYGNPVRTEGRIGRGYVGGFAYPGYLDFGYAGVPNAFDPDDPNNAALAYPQNSAQDAFENAPSDGPYASAPDLGTADFGSPQEASAPYASQPDPGRRYAPPPHPTAPLPEEDAVTIVFKDGRPPEQIHNYALTRTMLYITSGRVRTIPVEDIDLPATAKVNQKAGVDFQLPSTK